MNPVAVPAVAALIGLVLLYRIVTRPGYSSDHGTRRLRPAMVSRSIVSAVAVVVVVVAVVAVAYVLAHVLHETLGQVAGK